MYQDQIFQEEERKIDMQTNAFVANVFLLMFAALGVTALTAYFLGTNSYFLGLIYRVKFNSECVMSGFGWFVTFSPFIIVIVMTLGVNKLNALSIILLYIAYSILMGMSLSTIFFVYSTASIFKTFIIAAGMFGIMALLGYTTKTDLTGLGTILMMALSGIILALLLNLFMHSTRLEYIISIIGVIIFTGMTAYDVQKIKGMRHSGIKEGETIAKVTILAALNLYLDFLNLFLYLLRFLGKRD